MNKAIFLDRDGTINIDHGYLHNPDDLEFIDGVIVALRVFQSAGFKLIIITNQSGIGRNYFSVDEFYNFNNALIDALSSEGVKIEDTMMCPHAPEDNCVCRKPLPYLVELACQRYDIDKSQSFMFGDKKSDVECGERAGVESHLITSDENLLFWAERLIKL